MNRVSVRASVRQAMAWVRRRRTPRQRVRALTRLERNPPQLELLARLVRSHTDGLSRDIAIHGVADGSEAISLLAALAPEPEDDLAIVGFDHEAAWIELARRFTYPRQSVSPGARRFLRRTATGSWRLRRRWRRFVRFAPRDVMQPSDGATYALVMCQNVLVGFALDRLPTAVENLVAEVAPGGFLAIGGGPLDQVPQLVCGHGLEPVLDDVETIHEAWTVQRHFYQHETRPRWALEPFDANHPDGAIRFCTLFRRPGPAP